MCVKIIVAEYLSGAAFKSRTWTVWRYETNINSFIRRLLFRFLLGKMILEQATRRRRCVHPEESRPWFAWFICLSLAQQQQQRRRLEQQQHPLGRLEQLHLLAMMKEPIMKQQDCDSFPLQSTFAAKSVQLFHSISYKTQTWNLDLWVKWL